MNGDDLACPSWCAEDPRHGYSPEEVRMAGGVGRLHRSRPQTVIESATQEPMTSVTVRVERYVELSYAGEFFSEPPVVLVEGMPSCGLTACEAMRLAEAMAEAAATFSAVVAA